MEFIAAAASAFSQTFDWRGRASRSEFWWFSLLYLLCYVPSLVLSVMTRFPIFLLVLLGFAGPMLGVTVRRLHDIGRSGYWYFMSWLPGGAIVLIVFFCRRGTAGDNAYGPPPARLTGNSTVTRGMTKRQVVRLLGPPHEQAEAAPYERWNARRAMVGELPPERDYWHYFGRPDGVRETMIAFEMGRVVDITAG